MTVKEFIKGNGNYVISKNGEIVGIKLSDTELNLGKSVTDTSFLNEEVKETIVIKGVIEDVTAIRL